MKVLIATDAWKPQVNGVVATLGHLAEEAAGLGAEIEFVTPAEFRTVPLPNYPGGPAFAAAARRDGAPARCDQA